MVNDLAGETPYRLADETAPARTVTLTEAEARCVYDYVNAPEFSPKDSLEQQLSDKIAKALGLPLYDE